MHGTLGEYLVTVPSRHAKAIIKVQKRFVYTSRSFKEECWNPRYRSGYMARCIECSLTQA